MLSLVVSLLCLAHPFHVSVSDIKYKEEQKAIQISTRIFLDDLEVALQAFTGNEALDIVDKSNWEVEDVTRTVHLEKDCNRRCEGEEA